MDWWRVTDTPMSNEGHKVKPSVCNWARVVMYLDRACVALHTCGQDMHGYNNWESSTPPVEVRSCEACIPRVMRDMVLFGGGGGRLVEKRRPEVGR